MQDLIRLSFQNPPIYVGVHDTAEHSTADGLTQGYVVISAEKRFLLLFTFLRKYKGKKIMVFFSACKVCACSVADGIGNASCAPQARRRGRAMGCALNSTALIFLKFGPGKEVKRAQCCEAQHSQPTKLLRQPLPIQKHGPQKGTMSHVPRRVPKLCGAGSAFPLVTPTQSRP